MSFFTLRLPLACLAVLPIVRIPCAAQQTVNATSSLTEAKIDTRIYIRGDKAIDYGRVMAVMGQLNTAGFTRVALITELPERKVGG